MTRKIIVTCAVTGNAPFNPKHPNFPVTPEQIAASSIEAAKAGASIVHLHVRDIETSAGSRCPILFKEVVDRIRNSGVDIVINLTGGMGGFFLPDPENEGIALPESDVISVTDRMEHLKDCLPEIASLDVCTANQAEGDVEFVYLNTTRTLRAMAKQYQELGIKAELESFGAGDVLFANELQKEGLIDGPAMHQFVLGVKWGAPATPETVAYMKSLVNPGSTWTAMGLGRQQMNMAAQSILLGGHVRVGLEDNLYLKRGVFATNGQLVERACNLAETLGETVATPAETRQMLNLTKHG